MAEVPGIRLLGELLVVRDGRATALPASKKTRALLGYLALTGRPHTREELCDLLFQGPDDPRAALRWSLAKLRGVLGASAVVADRERIALGPVETDLGEVRHGARGGLSEVPTHALRASVDRFRGELLEGLGLPECYRYHEWFTAEREAARALRIALVAELELRHASNPEEALRWARERVSLDPLCEAGHVRVIRLLGDLGRKREALAQFETCRRILAEETGAKPSPSLLEARMQLPAGRASSPPGSAPSSSPVPSPTGGFGPGALPDEGDGRVPLLGRAAELASIESAIGRACAGAPGRVLALFGEPGIGKSRLLGEVERRIRGRGGIVIAGRAFEAEMVRPYGPFIDGLRVVSRDLVPESLRSDLGALMPEASDSGQAADRTSQFQAVTSLLAHLSNLGPVAVILDDLHWFDEASAGLLHYLTRTLDDRRVLVACGVRPGELSDNAPALRLVRSLSREGRLETLELGPLEPEATAALSLGIAPGVDVARVVEGSAGNPLFALELCRALARTEGAVWDSLGGLIGERLGRLEAPALELASWAAALGKSFDVETLERVTGSLPMDLLVRVGELERHGIVSVSADGKGYDFVHDLVRAGAYRRLSEPSRRVVHRHIARALAAAGGADPALAGEVAHHASLGGDVALAVLSALAAAQHCLKMFAGAEAARLATAGLDKVGELPRERRLPEQIALLEVLVYSGTTEAHSRRLKSELTRTVMEAEDAGRHDLAARGLNALSVVHYDGGDLMGAYETTLRAVDATQAVDPLDRARQLGASARCLVMLERDMEQAQSMYAEARALSDAAGSEILEVEWGGGALRAFKGELGDAAESLGRALAIARSAGDRWGEYECLRHLVQLDLESGKPTERAAELLLVASKMGEGSELPSARSLEALDRLVRADEAADESIESALATLRSVDAKGMLAYVLTFAAERDVAAGRIEAAERRAGEALSAATVVNRLSQMALARAVLARAALLRGDAAEAERHLDAVRPALARPLALSARARKAVTALLGASHG